MGFTESVPAGDSGSGRKTRTSVVDIVVAVWGVRCVGRPAGSTSCAVQPVGLDSSVRCRPTQCFPRNQLSQTGCTSQRRAVLNPFSIPFLSLLISPFPFRALRSPCRRCLPSIFPSFFVVLSFPVPSNIFVIFFFILFTQTFLAPVAPCASALRHPSPGPSLHAPDAALSPAGTCASPARARSSLRRCGHGLPLSQTLSEFCF